ncbi:MAG TPA: alpha/beta fold hydrolase [Candidatus Elarobacter sp.]|nr:alpha/beta fold hydrolase [Candidatus Elarobacter sp.]
MISDPLAKARALLDTIAAQEHADPEIAYPTRWWLRDEVADTAVVLLHGLTNSPPQYDALAPELFARGHAVVVPRMPYHGYRDRMTDAFGKVRRGDLAAAALQGVVIGALCGARVVVAGISVGAVLAGWLAARTRIDTAIAVAPFCGLREVPGGANDALGALLCAAPNRFSWWDPRAKEAQPPAHGYPRFSTRALGESLRLSTEIDDVPADSSTCARHGYLVLNEHEPVVNNVHAARRFDTLRRYGVAVERVVLHGLPHIHDVLEPAIPEARTELVYPKLIELIERG